jgi:glycosyltransferase involved in cell wall biosynthesis
MAPWIEETLASVHGQGYPNLEHVVADGGSTDGTLAILERWRSRLSALVSEPDRGLYDAVNKGFARTTGEVMGYLGADDLLLPGALATVGEVFAAFPDVDWITARRQGIVVGAGHVMVGDDLRGFGRRAFLRGEYLLGGPAPARTNLQAESTFWRRSLWERAGGRMSTEHGLAGDFELWARFFEHADVVGVPACLGAFRIRPGQLSRSTGDRYVNDCLAVLREHGGRFPGPLAAFALRGDRRRRGPRRLLRALLGLREPARRLRWDEDAGAWRIKRIRV